MPYHSNGDAAKGAALFKGNCSNCHSLAKSPIASQGPSLLGLFGRKTGQAEGFEYSDANIKKGIKWDGETCFEYLEDPAKYIPGTKMKFDGLKAETDRNDIIAYLKDSTK